MKNLTKGVLLAVTISSATVLSNAQNTGEIPLGQVIYSLPQTTIHITAHAESSSFKAGPYARYAQKYLGVEAKENDGTTYRMTGLDVTPYLEADPSSRFSINLNTKGATANFLKFTSQGLVAVSDAGKGLPDTWRFPSQADATAFLTSGALSNLTETKTTLYKSVRTAEGIERVPVKQSQVVEKSLEKKAQETASLIFRLRQKRIDIITGDTDATFDGEAMGATLAEIARLEKEYLEMFLGKTVRDTQSVSFDIIPQGSNEKQLIIAFRFSETEGILPPSNVMGSPVTVEITPGPDTDAVGNAQQSGTSRQQNVYYRIPANASVKISDGLNVMINTRIPVYQMGKTVAFPIEGYVK